MEIANNTVVTLEYTLRVDGQAEVVDTSEGRGPLVYLQGNENIIPGLERQLAGLQPGDKREIKVSPEEGYGTRDESLTLEIPREQAGPNADELKPGTEVMIGDGKGHTRPATVVSVDDKVIKLDANHPMAGKTLNFSIEVKEVRAATEEELSHGHVHGPGGHH